MFAAEIFAAAFQNAMDKAAHQTRIGPNQTRAILESRRQIGPTRIPRAMVPYLDADALSRQLDAESVPPLVPEYLELPPDICLARCKRQMIAKKGTLTRADLEGWRRFLRDTETGEAESEFLEEFAQRQSWLAPWKSNEDPKLNQDPQTRSCLAPSQRPRLPHPHLALRQPVLSSRRRSECRAGEIQRQSRRVLERSGTPAQGRTARNGNGCARVAQAACFIQSSERACRGDEACDRV